MTVATMNDFTSQLAEFDKIQDTCKKLLQTKHYQKLGEEGVHIIMAKAKALGIHPFEALNGGFFVVQGKVGMSTEMMAALVRQKGHSITKDSKSTDSCIILHGKRADNGDTWTVTFGDKEAEAAGLSGSQMYKKYKAVMYYNRAMSQLFRQLFPDLSLGAGYVEDELKEITRTGEYAQKADVKQLDIMAEVEEVPATKISMDQAFEIEQMLQQIPTENHKGFMDWISKRGYKVLSDISPEFFEEVKQKLRIKIAATKQAAIVAEERLPEAVNE